jgi:hypothetical protein
VSGTQVGVFLSVFLMFCLVSFLWRDNPFYKLAEHLFIGLSIGYYVTVQFWDVLKPTLWDKLVDNPDPVVRWGWYVIPAVLCLLMFARYVKPLAWLGRLPIAFVIGAFAGQNAAGYARGVLVPQTGATMQPLLGTAAMQESIDVCLESASGAIGALLCRYGDRVNALLIVVGVCSALLYFFFSAPHDRILGAVSRVGVLFLMLAFGASFGFTVMGRIALAVGRAQQALDAPVASIASILLIVAGLVVWSRWAAPRAP